jgi:hypothetical protein
MPITTDKAEAVRESQEKPEVQQPVWPPCFMEPWEIEINEVIWRQQADGWFDGGACGETARK